MQAVPGFTPRPPYTPLEDGLILSFRWYFWGVILSTTLFGVTLIQGWAYLTSEKKDGWKITTVVCVTLALDIANSLLTAIATQNWLVDNFGNVAELSEMTVALNLEQMTTVLVTTIVQLFFARQIFTVNSKSLPVVVVIVILSLGSLALGLSVTVETFINFERSSLNSTKLTVLIATGQGLNVACDLVATIAMTCMLTYSRTHVVQSTRSLIKSLVVYFISRGLFLSAIQISFMVAFVAGPYGTHWTPFHLISGKCYVNTLLLMLNARSSLRKKSRPVSTLESDRPHRVRHIALSKLDTSSGTANELSQFPSKNKLDRDGSHHAVDISRVEESFNDDGTVHTDAGITP